MPATDTSAGSSAAAQLAALVEENTSPAGPPKAMPAPPPPSWDVFARAEYERARLAEERSEEHTSELQSLMRISYAVFCLKKTKMIRQITDTEHPHKYQLHIITT